MAEQGTDDMAMRDDASGVTDGQAGLECEYLRERRRRTIIEMLPHFKKKSD